MYSTLKSKSSSILLSVLLLVASTNNIRAGTSNDGVLGGARNNNVSLIKRRHSMFGVLPNDIRGGAIFGNGGGSKESVDDDASDAVATKTDLPKYPAMTRPEIEKWLNHIPVFAVTDDKGSAVVLRPENATSVFYFFMSPAMANATLETLKAQNSGMELKVSTFSLGMIWFDMLHSDGEGREVTLKSPGGDDDDSVSAMGIEYRLIPDTRDLMGARMLLTMDPEDGEKLKEGGNISKEEAEKVIAKAIEETPKFKKSFNEVPVFIIQQLRLTKNPKAAEGGEDDSTGDDDDDAKVLPMFFGLQSMVGFWQKLGATVEPAISVMDLYETVEMMQEECEIDFRNTILYPQATVGGQSAAEDDIMGGAPALDGAGAAPGGGGDTLGDL